MNRFNDEQNETIEYLKNAVKNDIRLKPLKLDVKVGEYELDGEYLATLSVSSKNKKFEEHFCYVLFNGEIISTLYDQDAKEHPIEFFVDVMVLEAEAAMK